MKFKRPSKLFFLKAFNAFAGFVSFLFIVGIIKYRPSYFVYANTAVKSFLAGWLVYRFRDPKNVVLSDFDRHACFVAGSYILIATFAEYSQYIQLLLLQKI